MRRGAVFEATDEAGAGSTARPDTIVALATPMGRGGVAVVRVSGPRAAESVLALARSLPMPRRASLRALCADGAPIDDGLVLWFPGPASFTGEDVSEFHVHGSPAVLRALIAALTALPGIRLAEPGEFTRRAFLNGKLDLLEVEGLADLLDAETESQRVQALAQLRGQASQRHVQWRALAIDALALAEAQFDFADEGDVPESLMEEVEGRARTLLDALSSALQDAPIGERIRDGLMVVIAGPPNAGKSTLLNRFARRDVAIVSPEPGTTRDAIEIHLDLRGFPVILVDTAGLREKGGAVEREGIARAMSRIADADLVLWVEDATRPGDAEPPQAPALWRVFNKADLAPAPAAPGAFSVSARTGAGLEDLESALSAFAQERLTRSEPPVITRARHRAALEEARGELSAFLDMGALPLDLRIERLRRAVYALGRVTGHVGVEDLLDAIFSRFCIGK